MIAALVVTQRDSGPAKAFERSSAGVVEEPEAGAEAGASAARAAPGGRLLVTDGDAPGVVERSGKRRGSARWEDATWSPQGLFVGVTADHTLAAIQPRDGDDPLEARPARRP